MTDLLDEKAKNEQSRLPVAVRLEELRILDGRLVVVRDAETRIDQP